MIFSTAVLLAGAATSAAVAAAVHLADTVSAPADPITWVTGLGFPGLLIGLLVTGWLRTKSEVDHLIAESAAKDALIEKKDEMIAQLQRAVVQQTMPALARSTELLEAVPSEAGMLRELRDVLSEAVNRIERAARKT